MDTKVEQEVFGIDPSDPDYLDNLLDHIHAEPEEHEIQPVPQQMVTTG